MDEKARAELLLGIGRRLAGELDLDRALDALGGSIVPGFADWCGVYLLDPERNITFANTYHRDPALREAATAYLKRNPISLDAPDGLGRTLRTGETRVIPDLVAYLDRLPLAPEQRRALDAFPVRGVAYIALRVAGRVIGALTVAREQAGRPFTPDDVLLLEDIAARAAASVENARLLRELREREERLRAQNAALLRLAKLPPRAAEDLAGAARAITEESARTLRVERVSVWLYDEARSAIRCLDLFESTPGRHGEGLELLKRDFPAYFEALATERAIAAEDARADPRTREFTKTYLEPLGITSMLDAPLRAGDRLVGVLCHEHVGPARRWRPEEELFAGALADLLSLAIEAQGRGRAVGMLRESEERFTRMADDAPIGIWLTDAQAKNVWNNRWRMQLMGASQEDLLGDGWTRYVHPDDMAREFERVWPRVQRHEPFETMHRIRAAAGDWRHMLNVANPRFGAEGRFLGYIGAEFDITERVEAQRALAEARRDLARGERLAAMGSLVSGVAHEIRTPLAYIANSTALLKRHVPRDAQEHLAAIEEGVARVNALVNDLRRFTKVETGPLVPTRLDEVVANAARMWEATHRARAPLALRLTPTPLVPLDASRVQQVVLNLLENAAEASPPGAPIRLETRATPTAAELVVADEGPGIAPEVQARMFEPFYTTKTEGTGLGLSIVRRIVETHQGRITCESALGKGSTFIVSFPLAAPR